MEVGHRTDPLIDIQKSNNSLFGLQDLSYSKVAIIVIGILLALGGALATYFLYGSLGNLSFTALPGVPLGSALIALGFKNKQGYRITVGNEDRRVNEEEIKNLLLYTDYGKKKFNEIIIYCDRSIKFIIDDPGILNSCTSLNSGPISRRNDIRKLILDGAEITRPEWGTEDSSNSLDDQMTSDRWNCHKSQGTTFYVNGRVDWNNTFVVQLPVNSVDEAIAAKNPTSRSQVYIVQPSGFRSPPRLTPFSYYFLKEWARLPGSILNSLRNLLAAHKSFNKNIRA